MRSTSPPLSLLVLDYPHGMQRPVVGARVSLLVGVFLWVGCVDSAPGVEEDSLAAEVGTSLDREQEVGFSFEEAALGVVRIEAEGCLGESIGTGILIDERHVVTVAHVVAASDEILVKTESETGRAVAIGFDEERDLALLRTDAPMGSRYLPLGDYEYETGDQVFAIGYPLGLEASLVTGVVSNAEVSFDDLPLSRFLQVDAPLNPGNSGGPVFNDRGEVIGLVDWQFSEAAGLSFAITTSSITRIVDSWLGEDEVPTGECDLALEESDTTPSETIIEGELEPVEEDFDAQASSTTLSPTTSQRPSSSSGTPAPATTTTTAAPTTTPTAAPTTTTTAAPTTTTAPSLTPGGDSSPPSISGLSYPTSVASGGTVRVTGTATDPSGIKRLALRIGDVACQPGSNTDADTSGYPTSIAFDLTCIISPSQVAGMFPADVWVEDSLQNWGAPAWDLTIGS